MQKPLGYDPVLAAKSDCPEEWIDYFLGVDDDEEEDESFEDGREVESSDSSLFNVSEEQVENPNFWINL